MNSSEDVNGLKSKSWSFVSDAGCYFDARSVIVWNVQRDNSRTENKNVHKVCETRRNMRRYAYAAFIGYVLDPAYKMK